MLTVPHNSNLVVNDIKSILGDPGAVSRVGRKGGKKVFKSGERAPGYRLSPNYFQKLSGEMTFGRLDRKAFEPGKCGKTIAVVNELTKRTQEKLFANWAQ